MTSYSKNIQKSLNSQKIEEIRIQILEIGKKGREPRKKCNKKNTKNFLRNNAKNLIAEYHINLREYQLRSHNHDESI